MIPTGGLIAAIVLSGLFIIFEVLVYASMIAVMPRAGGDYVWQTRVFGGGVGFVLAATGWWFILWHWVPIYANILILEVIQPILNVLGYNGTDTFHAAWWNPIHGTGIFVASIFTAVIATVVVSAGMRWYARFQKWCFYGAMAGLVFMIARLPPALEGGLHHRVQQPDGHLRDTRLERLPGHGRRGPQGRSVVPGLRLVRRSGRRSS